MSPHIANDSSPISVSWSLSLSLCLLQRFDDFVNKHDVYIVINMFCFALFIKKYNNTLLFCHKPEYSAMLPLYSLKVFKWLTNIYPVLFRFSKKTLIYYVIFTVSSWIETCLVDSIHYGDNWYTTCAFYSYALVCVGIRICACKLIYLFCFFFVFFLSTNHYLQIYTCTDMHRYIPCKLNDRLIFYLHFCWFLLFHEILISLLFLQRPRKESISFFYAFVTQEKTIYLTTKLFKW